MPSSSNSKGPADKRVRRRPAGSDSVSPTGGPSQTPDGSPLDRDPTEEGSAGRPGTGGRGDTGEKKGGE
jgi:hypothetical protein